MALDHQTTLDILDTLCEALDQRVKLLHREGFANIDTYNKEHPMAPLRRMVFACDEVAMMLEKSKPKAEKELIYGIESALAKLTAIGRTVGIHVFLSTQRPDAVLLRGDIRANLGAKVCGRADDILSDIVINNKAASELIPKNAQGRFILNDETGDNQATIFQAYWLDR